MTAAFGLTERVPRFILQFPPSWGSAVIVWRCARFYSLKQKQEVRYFRYCESKLSLLTLGFVPHHQQKAFTKKSYLLDMPTNIVFSSSKLEHNHGIGIQPFFHETAIESLVSASNAKVAGEAMVENEPNFGTSRIDPIVYKRRSRRNMVAKKFVTVTEGSHDKLMDSETVACDAPLQGQSEEANTKASRRSGRKKNNTKVASECMEIFEHTESGSIASSPKKKVARKKASAKARVSRTEHVMESCSQSIKESSMETKNVEMAASNGYEEDTMDTLVEKVSPWLMLVHKKVQSEWSVYNPLAMRRPEPEGNSLKLLSWNVNGLRALIKGKGDELPGSAISKLAERENFDVLCLQETKLQEKDVLTIKEMLLPAYENSLWSCSIAKLGYSGTAIISRIKPLSITYGFGIPKHDNEGRVISIEFDKFFLVTCYVPNSGQKLERLGYRTQEWDLSLANFLKDLEKQKPVILTGDLNCAHQEIDIYNPDGNRRSAGFTDEERTSFEKNFLENGFNDTFRKLHPNAVAYTYWGYRSAARPKNQGWRLDYYLASDALSDVIHDSYTLPDVGGSDHCPIGLILKL